MLLSPLTLLSLACAPPQVAGPLPQDAYLWQQAWTPAVQEAAYAHPFRDLVILGGTLGVEGEAVIFERPSLPPGSAVALRVDALPPGEDSLVRLQDALARLAVAHPEAPYLQVDMDLPTARLGEYASWMQALNQAGLPPLRITALPTWLGAAAFAELAQAAPHYVLQLHWLNPAAPTHLLDPEALAHIEQAAGFGVPFSVALPAYSYTLHYDAEGAQAGLSAEQGQAPPPGGHSEVLRTDPAAVAALVATLNTEHPAALESVIWFRLPTTQDENSWHMDTLASVAEGRVPKAQAELSVASTGEDLWQLTLHNRGDDDLELPPLRWPHPPSFWDALGPYHRSGGALQARGRLAPGDAVVVAWARAANAPALEVFDAP